jgi:tRNA (guanine37-N1)-methyltransferase
MQLSVVTLFPEMFAAITDWGISGRAVKQGLVSLDFYNPRDYTTDKHRTVDDKPFGGGPGMLMKTEPLIAAIHAAKCGSNKQEQENKRDTKVIYLSPQGRHVTNQDIVDLASLESLALVCGRYQGIDNRVIDSEIDEELSLGDFVISGGELAAMALIDAMIRFQPGALGDDDSAQQDSFSNGLLHCPEYTRPKEFAGKEVPEVLLSGNHAAIDRWRLKQSLGATWIKRPDLIDRSKLSQDQQEILDQFINEYQT